MTAVCDGLSVVSVLPAARYERTLSTGSAVAATGNERPPRARDGAR
jgi:hypothetical protein